MSFIKTMLALWDFNRARTLGLLEKIAELPDPQAVLGWRPGPGRAHIAWQLMHVGITEELFATERLAGTAPHYADLVPRFKGGSTPDGNIPSVELLREVLTHSRQHLTDCVSSLTEADFEKFHTEFLQTRQWTVRTALTVIGWHEAHHHGQAHITLNLWNAGQDG